MLDFLKLSETAIAINSRMADCGCCSGTILAIVMKWGETSGRNLGCSGEIPVTVEPYHENNPKAYKNTTADP